MSEAKSSEAASISLESEVTLRSGIKMPLNGIGTWLSSDGGECKAAVRTALEAGVPMVDTAQMYKNEADVGAGIREHLEANPGAKRPFVVTKLSGDNHGADRVRPALVESLEKLGLPCVDLFLVHSPAGKQCVETWRAMLQVRDEGLARAVGVSNFGIEHIEGLREAQLELPEVNQFELHVWLQQREAVQWMKDNGIVVMGYCPLARCKQFGATSVAQIAEQNGLTEAALAIRWSLEKGYVTIPKSSNPQRIVANAEVANREPLSAEVMAALDAADCNFMASNSVRNMWKPWNDFK